MKVIITYRDDKLDTYELEPSIATKEALEIGDMWIRIHAIGEVVVISAEDVAKITARA